MKAAYFIFCILLCGFLRQPEPVNIYTIGDSTMANKKDEVYPETGWCQVLYLFFDNTVKIHNHAVNGRSTKSFITEGRWKAVLDSLKKGDIVFIQFAHNDQKEADSSRYTNPYTGYRRNLIKFINETRSRNAIPVLITPVVRRNFNEKGSLIDTHGAYPEVMRSVAKEMDVLLIDMQMITEEMVLQHGFEKSKNLYLHVAAGNANYPSGKADNTHLSYEGAKLVAEKVAGIISGLNLAISNHVVFTQ